MSNWRVGVWSAVSSRAQAADDKISLIDQAQLGQDFAAGIGGAIVSSYTVPGHSRDYWNFDNAASDMPAYAALRADAEAHRIDLLWCYDSSRLGRDPALVQAVISLVERNGGEVYNHSQPHLIGSKSISHRYLDAFGAVTAGAEQVQRVARHRSGMRGRVQRGLFAGAVPLGYGPVRDEASGDVVAYEVTPDAAAVRHVTRLFLDGYPLSEIRRRMDASPYTPARGEAWSTAGLRYILSNDAYAGFPAWGNYRYDGAEPSPFYPPLWDAALYAEVVRERSRRRRGPVARTAGSAVAGICICARCGSRMYRTDTHPVPRLRCSQHVRSHMEGTPGCHANYTPERTVIRAITARLYELQTDEAIEEVIASYPTSVDGDHARALAEQAVTDTARIQRERNHLALLAARTGMEDEVYRAADTTLQAELESMEAQLVDAERVLDSLPDLDERREMLRKVVRKMVLNFPLAAELEPATILRALDVAGVRVYCENGKVLKVEP